eukprot:TRINITY_DN3652_c0_g1_i1.p1 TRINITY_DN3652_c0_g1~~TRINITY_DN3652_c0_g1_i1.p1  ORF type:complete len:391 (+),score=81.02 TRINITY_DN3652_c0_g1_i1:123-1175(+)
MHLARPRGAPVLLSSHVVGETPKQSLRRVVLRTQRSADDNAQCLSDGGDSDESDGSANEYAEGLGCADSRRCKMKPESRFEFDNHPREEYFEEPKSADQHGRCIELPVSSSSRALKSVLLELQAQEEAEELRKPKRQRTGQAECRKAAVQSAPATCMEQAECGQAAVRFAPATYMRQEECGQAAVRSAPATFMRKAECGQAAVRFAAAASRRMIMGQAECGQAAVRSELAATSQEKKQPPCQQHQSVLAQIRAHSACLAVMRSRIERASAQPGLFEELQSDIQKDCQEALKTMCSLGLLQIGASELKATGIGRELSRPAWQMHPSKKVSESSQSLVAKWRKAAKARAAGC